MTPRMLLLDAAKRLQGAEIPDPQVDGALLLAHLTGRHPLELRMDGETQLAGRRLQHLKRCWQRDCNAIPCNT